MRFQVPQFIETETKLVGPFTLKQFLWLASGGGLTYILYAILNQYIFFVLAIPIGGFFIALAFVKINEIPLISYVLYALSYFSGPKKFVFKKEQEADIRREIIISEENK